MLFSENKFLPGNRIVEETSRKVLEQAYQDLEFYAEYLDASRFPGQNYYKMFRQYLHEKYAGRPPDLILAFLTTQFELAGQLPAELFPKAPVVFGALTEEEVRRARIGRNATGVVVRMDPMGTLATMLQLQPATKKVVVISGAAPLDRLFFGKTQAAARSLSDRLQFEYWVGRPLREIEREVASLPKQTVILFTNMFRDAAGETFVPEEVAAVIAKSANVPVYALVETSIGGGSVGGKVVHFEAAGRRIGEIALHILDGVAPATIPPEVHEAGSPIFDWRALKRWRINQSRLPPGSILRFREPTIWDKHKGYIIVAFIVMLAEAALIASLIMSRMRRRRIEGDLRESQRRMSLAANAANLALWTWDIEHDEIWLSPEGLRFFGWNSEVPFNLQGFLQGLHPDDRDPVREAIEKSVETCTEYSVEFRVANSTATNRWLSARGQVEFDSNGRALRMRGVVTDISEQKHRDSELQRTRDELAHVTRISTMGELAASLAHELNQPLTAILSNAQAAQRFIAANPAQLEEVSEILKDIIEDNNRAGEVIRRIRSLVRKEPLKVDRLDITNVIEEVITLVHSDSILSNVRVSLECDAGLPNVHADKVQVQQVLLNLMLNAFDAMQDCPMSEKEVLVRVTSTTDSAIQVAVCDRGTGLTVAKLDRLFEPFFTTKRDGLGMGLSISRSIVEAHKGKLWAENNHGRGATFYFTVPVEGSGGKSSDARGQATKDEPGVPQKADNRTL